MSCEQWSHQELRVVTQFSAARLVWRQWGSVSCAMAENEQYVDLAIQAFADGLWRS